MEKNKKRRKQSMVPFVVLVIIAVVYFVILKPFTVNKDCLPAYNFGIYEFNAEVVNKFESNGVKALTLVTFQGEPKTLDLSTEKNGLFESLTIGDTLKKKTNTMFIHVQNFDKKEDFECDFSCDEEIESKTE